MRKRTIHLFIFLFLLASCAPQAQTSEVSETSEVLPTPPPTLTPIPTPTVHPQIIAVRERLAQSETYSLNSDGEIEMQTEEGVKVIPDLSVDINGQTTLTIDGETYEVDETTIKMNDQTFSFKTENGKTWVFDGEKISEEIREFIPANTIEFTETLSNYDLKLAPDADLKGIYWDIAVSHLGDVISKSPGMEANRAIYEEIIKDHPEWKGISHSWDYEVRVAFMKEFLTRSGGRMTVQNHNFEKFEADFNLPIGFNIINTPKLETNYIRCLINAQENAGGGGGLMFVDENGQMIYQVAIVPGSLEHTTLTDSRSIYKSWNWTAGEVISNIFRITISQTAYKDRDSNLHKYELYTKGGVLKSGSFYMNTYWTFIK